jgi:hypothetical protein
MGIIAASFGAIAVAGHAGHILGLTDGERSSALAAKTVASIGGRALLVVAETLASLLFTLVAIAMLERRNETISTLGTIAALVKTLWLIGSLAVNWDGGWYYALDPKGPHPITIWMILASAGQAVTLVVAAVLASRALPHAPR